MKRRSKVKAEWNSKFAYAIGLLATDGNLSKDGRHIDLTSKDKELILKFRACLGIDNKVGIKYRGKDGYARKEYFRVQLGDINFYQFLLSIGLNQKKSKIMNSLKIPKEFFRDFLRGCIDGDGSIGSFKHPESKYPQVRVRLVSASQRFLEWVKLELKSIIGINGGWIYSSKNVFTLAYAKTDSITILEFLYNKKDCICLSRKLKKAENIMGEWRNWDTRGA